MDNQMMQNESVEKSVCHECKYIKKRYISPKELSEYLGLAVGTIYHLVASRTIPFYKFNKSVRFSIEEINKWVGSRKVSNLDI